MAQQAIHKFVLGNKEVDGKNAEFQYDHGWYSIVHINGEEKEILYKSRDAQEAYMKWNVYIGRKKERPMRDYAQNDTDGRENRNYHARRRTDSKEEEPVRRNSAQGDGRSYQNEAPEDDRGRRSGAQEDDRGRRSGAQEENRGHRNHVQREDRSRRNYSREDDHSRGKGKTVQERETGSSYSRNRSTAKGSEEHINSSRIQNRQRNSENSRSYGDKTENRQNDSPAGAHRNIEKRKAKARKEWSRRRRAQEGEPNDEF